MSKYGINSTNLLDTFPEVLKNDKRFLALGVIIAKKLSERVNEIDRLQIYTRLDEQPEPVLDILAKDYKVDWWDYSYSLEEKRRTLKDSWNIHRTRGTSGAVERAISAIYPGTRVSEWFEYSGDPFYFKLLIDATYQDVDAAKHQRVLERVRYYKNRRSHLDGIEYTAVPAGYCRSFGAVGFVGYSINATARVNVLGLNQIHCRTFGGIGIAGMVLKLNVEVNANGVG